MKKKSDFEPNIGIEEIKLYTRNTFKRWSLPLHLGVHKRMEQNEMSKSYMNGMG